MTIFQQHVGSQNKCKAIYSNRYLSKGGLMAVSIGMDPDSVYKPVSFADPSFAALFF